MCINEFQRFNTQKGHPFLLFGFLIYPKFLIFKFLYHKVVCFDKERQLYRNIPLNPLLPLNPFYGPQTLAGWAFAGRAMVQIPSFRGSDTEFPWFRYRVSMVQIPTPVFNVLILLILFFHLFGAR